MMMQRAVPSFLSRVLPARVLVLVEKRRRERWLS